jgi:alkylhydroperoxidase family enzyme
MARLPYVDSETASPDVAAVLGRLPDLNIFKLLAHAEGAFKPFLRFGAALLQDLTLDPVLRELAILRVAALTPGAEYEWVQHESIARELGVSSDLIEGARTGSGLTGDAEIIVRFTGQVVVDARPDDATLAEAAARFTPREIVELLLVIGMYMMLARVMATAEIDVDLPTTLEQLSGSGPPP